MMNIIRIVLMCLWCWSLQVHAQPQVLRESDITHTITEISDLIETNYIFPDVARRIRLHLKKRVQEQVFQNVTRDTLAVLLTREIGFVAHDKHMRVRVGRAPARLFEGLPAENNGFSEFRLLPDDIAYINMWLFFPPDQAAAKLDSIFVAMKDARAFIIDMRQNRGGSPQMVQYLCSYFFKERTHLNSLYNRIENRTTEFWTIPVNGLVRADVPLYILTSRKTFSAGEEFCYDMKSRKRATLVGEVTGGGANPGRVFPVKTGLTIFIPTGRAINPVTGTNWEGTGVQPDLLTTEKDALEEALRLIEQRKKHNDGKP